MISMTLITVVTTITTIDTGKVEIGDFDLTKLTVADVKNLVEKEATVPASSQMLWWRGYALDDDSLPLTKACIGVNQGEFVDRTLESLVIFMTVDIQLNRSVDASMSPMRKLRSYSFDVEKVRAEFKKREQKCLIS